MAPRKITESMFVEIEMAMGMELPDDLKEVYGKKNGGRPTGRYYLGKDGDDYEVARLHKFLDGSEDGSSIEDEYRFFTSERRLFSPEFIPFAEDSGGGQFCVCRREQGVWFWNPDDFDAKDLAAALHKIAGSIDEFLSGLLSFSAFKEKCP